MLLYIQLQDQSNYDVYVVVWQDLFDYEVDSDDEWEEEEPGESLSASEVLSDYKQSSKTVLCCLISLSYHLSSAIIYKVILHQPFDYSASYL